VCLGFPAGHVEFHLAQDGLGHHYVDAIDTGEVHSGDALHFAAQIEPWSILGGLGLLALRLRLRPGGHSGIRKSCKMFLQLLIAFGDASLVSVVHLQFLL